MEEKKSSNYWAVFILAPIIVGVVLELFKKIVDSTPPVPTQVTSTPTHTQTNDHLPAPQSPSDLDGVWYVGIARSGVVQFVGTKDGQLIFSGKNLEVVLGDQTLPATWTFENNVLSFQLQTGDPQEDALLNNPMMRAAVPYAGKAFIRKNDDLFESEPVKTNDGTITYQINRRR